MKPQSAKVKGRKCRRQKPISIASRKKKGADLQKWTVDQILKVHPSLEPDDVTSRSMGANGEDILLSPQARRLFPFSIECKSRASWAFYKDLDQATINTPKDVEPILVAKANHRKPVVIVDAEYFFNHVQPRKTRSRK